MLIPSKKIIFFNIRLLLHGIFAYPTYFAAKITLPPRNTPATNIYACYHNRNHTSSRCSGDPAPTKF